MAEVFGWFPDTEGEETRKPAVEATKFGDGYEQRVSDSINSDAGKWKLTFTRDRAEIAAIRAFLRRMGAKTAFAWTNPFGETGRYVCREFSTTSLDSTTSNVLRLSAEFEEVFEY